MGFENAPRHVLNNSDRDYDKPVSFKEMVHDIFNDSSSARVGRMLDLNQRTAQKWISTDTGMPKDIYDAVAVQHALYTKHNPRARIIEAILALQALGIHNEVIGSELATIYSDLMGHAVR